MALWIKRSAVTRGAAVLLAIALLPVAWLAAVMLFFGGLINAQVPDRSISDGDPCCGYPDTWWEVGGGLVWTAAMGAALALALWSIFVLVRSAATSWSPRPRRWLIFGGSGATLATMGFGVLLTFSATARQPTDCRTFSVARARFQSPDREVRRTEAYRIADCGFASDLRGDQVRDLLGEPEQIRRPRSDLAFWRYRDLEVEFLDGVAIGSEIYPYEGHEE
jgi:hypothetical protein